MWLCYLILWWKLFWKNSHLTGLCKTLLLSISDNSLYENKLAIIMVIFLSRIFFHSWGCQYLFTKKEETVAVGFCVVPLTSNVQVSPALIQQLPLCRSKCSIISELSRVLSPVLGRGAQPPTQSRGFPHFTTGSPLLSFWWQFHKRKQCTVVLHEDFHSSPRIFAGAKTKA